jgi:hypothetical protein
MGACIGAKLVLNQNLRREIMGKLSRLAVSILTTLLLLGAFASAADQKPGPSRDNVPAAPIAPPPAVNEVIGRTFITTNSPSITLPAGFNTEDSGISFSCPSGTCTLVVDSFATSGANSFSGNNRALCLVVDSTIVGACAYDGSDATDGTYSAVNAINTFKVSAGAHSAFMYFYTVDGTTMYTYTNVYRLYRP